MNGLQIVCLGAGSEYALAPLAREAVRRGFRVLEIDMYGADWRTIQLPKIERPFALVTSHHPYVSSAAHLKGFGKAADLDTVGAFVARERPLLSYFVPHDLSEHLHPEEYNSLHLFDALFMPNESHWFLREWVRVEPVGWMKAAEDAALDPVALTFLPSDSAFYCWHPELFERRFAPILRRSPRFKLARFAGIEILEAIARDAGCEVIPADVPSTAVIRATAAVVSNGLSSVVAEASAMGKATLCVADGLHPLSEQGALLAHLTNATIAAPDACDAWLDNLAGVMPAGDATQGGSVDFDRLFAVIAEQAASL